MPRHVKRRFCKKVPLYDPAWNYDRRIGEIWVLDVGAYDGEPFSDRIGVADPSMSQGGGYDNR